MRARAPLLALAAALLATGCAPGGLYRWNGYDESLYRHYKSPADRQAWVESLETTIRASEQEGLKVPPGIYAEYGYALFEEGRAQDAIVYFRKEREKWPESRFLMDKMIRNAEKRAGTAPLAPAATTGPAGALEKTR